MKCPKCGYHSFDHLNDCKKCGNDLTSHKAKFKLRSFFFPDSAAAGAHPPAEENLAAEEQHEDASVDFGFEFLDEQEPAAKPAAAELTLDDDSQEFDIDQPFGIDGESLPADSPEVESPPKKKTGSEFSF